MADVFAQWTSDENVVYEQFVPIRKRKGGPQPPGSTPASRFTILLEDIQGKVQLTMEAVTGLRGEIDALRTELSRRIDILEMAVRQNSEDIRKNGEDVRKNSADIVQLRADVRQNTEEIRSMRELLERKADHETLLRLEARVQVVERRLGIQ